MTGALVGNGFWTERLSYLSALTDADALAVLLLEDAGATTVFGTYNISAEDCRLDPNALAKAASDRVPVEAEDSFRLADGRTASGVCLAPIVVHDRVVGVMVGARVDRVWRPMDRLTLLKAAGLAAVDLNEALAVRTVQTATESLARNARLEQELYRDMHTVDDVNSFLENAPQQLAQRFGADRVSLMLLESDNALVVRSAFGLREDIVKQAKRRLGEGIAGWVAQHGESLLLTGPVDESRFQGVDPSIGSAIVAPLRVRDRIIGVVNVKARDDAAAYGAGELDQLTRIAGDLGLALVRGQLRSNGRRPLDTERAHVHVLFELSRLAMFGQARRNLDAATALLSDALHQDVVGIWLLNGTKSLRRVASRGYTSQRPDEIELAGDPHIGQVISEVTPLALDPLEPASWAVAGVAHYVVAPIPVETSVRGIVVQGRRARPYEPRDLEFAGVLGTYLGLMVAAYQRQLAELSPLLPLRDRLMTELTDVVLTLEVLQRLLRSDPGLPERVAHAAREAQQYLSELNTFTSADRPNGETPR